MEQITFSATAKVEGRTLSGVVHTFGNRASVNGHYEEFSSGAFDDVLKTSDVRAFVQHDHSKLLGRQSSGTLRLNATPQAIEYELDLPDTTYANDLKTLVERGDITEMSFGFVPNQYTWSKAEDGQRVRLHTKVGEFVDVSPVAIPAFSGTQLQLHSKSFDGETLKSQVTRAKARHL